MRDRGGGVISGGGFAREDKDGAGERDEGGDDDDEQRGLHEARVSPLDGVERVAADVEEDEALEEVGERGKGVEQRGARWPRHVLQRVVADGHAAEEEREDAGEAREVGEEVREEGERAHQRHLLRLRERPQVLDGGSDGEARARAERAGGGEDVEEEGEHTCERGGGERGAVAGGVAGRGHGAQQRHGRRVVQHALAKHDGVERRVRLGAQHLQTPHAFSGVTLTATMRRAGLAEARLQHGDRVRGGEDGGEGEAVGDGEDVGQEREPVERGAEDGEGDEGAEDAEGEDGEQVGHEEAALDGEAAVEDDGRQHVREEGGRVEGERLVDVVGVEDVPDEEEDAAQHAEQARHAALGDPARPARAAWAAVPLRPCCALRDGRRPARAVAGRLHCAQRIAMQRRLRRSVAAPRGTWRQSAHQWNMPWILWPKMSQATMMETMKVADQLLCSTGSSLKGDSAGGTGSDALPGNTSGTPSVAAIAARARAGAGRAESV